MADGKSRLIIEMEDGEVSLAGECSMKDMGFMIASAVTFFMHKLEEDFNADIARAGLMALMEDVVEKFESCPTAETVHIAVEKDLKEKIEKCDTIEEVEKMLRQEGATDILKQIQQSRESIKSKRPAQNKPELTPRQKAEQELFNRVFKKREESEDV